jgi:hypothetical protein
VYSHIVIIGGTGMLSEVSNNLAGSCGILTSVARTQRSLRALDKVISNTGCEHRMLALDWSDPESFVGRLAAHVRGVGPPALVVAWLHEDRLGPRIASALAPQDGRCRFFQVRGSAAANPENHAKAFLGDFDIPEAVDYFQVILGFHLGDKGSRWLDHAEIASGVQRAIDNPRPVSIVGTVETLSSHP